MIDLPTLTILLAFAVPILGIGLAGYQEWLKFRSKQQQLGASTKEVEETISELTDRVDALERERDTRLQRIQNLETIVTSEAWDALAQSAEEADPLLDQVDPEHADESLRARSRRSDPAERADALARRLRQ